MLNDSFWVLPTPPPPLLCDRIRPRTSNDTFLGFAYPTLTLALWPCRTLYVTRYFLGFAYPTLTLAYYPARKGLYMTVQGLVRPQ
jgi:hypothetical protein